MQYPNNLLTKVQETVANIDHFSSYIKTYGTIGAFMAFIIWLYITGYILIIGAEINAIFHNYKVEHRVFEETHTTEQKINKTYIIDKYKLCYVLVFIYEKLFEYTLIANF